MSDNDDAAQWDDQIIEEVDATHRLILSYRAGRSTPKPYYPLVKKDIGTGQPAWVYYLTDRGFPHCFGSPEEAHAFLEEAIQKESSSSR